MNKIRLLGVLLLCILLVLSACGSGASQSNGGAESNGDNSSTSKNKYVLKAVHGYSTTSTMHDLATWFSDEVEKRSNGRLTVEVYPNAQIVPVDQEIPAMLNGQVDITLSSSNALAAIEDGYYVLELPFLFDYDPKDVSVFLKDMRAFLSHENGGQQFANKLEKKGLIVLSNTANADPGVLWTTKKIVTDVESIKGLKTRVPGGLGIPETLKVLGASGVSIPATEQITALHQGVVDATINPVIYALDYKIPVKSGTLLPLAAYGNPLVISKAKYESLPADLQEILIEVGKDLEPYSDENVKNRYATVFDELEKSGIPVHYPTKEELEEWRTAVEPVYKWFTEKVNGGKELIDAASKDN